MPDDRDPYPWSWEIPVLGVAALTVLVLAALHMGRGVACLIAGYGWRWPARTALITTVPAIVHGDAGAGLTGPVSVSQALLLGMIIAVEALTIVLFVVVLRELLMRWGPRALRGVATGGEAERLLGRSRLRRVRRIVRPDLVSAKPSTNRSGANRPGTNRAGINRTGIKRTGSNRRSR